MNMEGSITLFLNIVPKWWKSLAKSKFEAVLMIFDPLGHRATKLEQVYAKKARKYGTGGSESGTLE